MDALTKLKRAFDRALGVPISDHESLEYRVIPAWDSVAHMSLIGEIESQFDVMLETEDVIGMSSFAKAREILVRHGVQFGA